MTYHRLFLEKPLKTKRKPAIIRAFSFSWFGIDAGQSGLKSNDASKPKIFPKPVDLMHPLKQYRHDTDVTITKAFPVNEVLFKPKKEPFDTELGWNQPRHYLVRRYLVECLKQTDISR